MEVLDHFWSQKLNPFFGPRPRFRWFKFVVPVGNFLIKTASDSTGGLEPPDFVVTDMQRVSGRRCHVFLTTPIGVFGRGLDSALMYERPRAPDLCCFIFGSSKTQKSQFWVF